MSSDAPRRSWATPTRLVVLSFSILILAGTILLVAPISATSGNVTRLIDAAFTATSAVCVTGLVVVNTASHWSVFGKVVILILLQVGGLGLMTFSTLHALFTGRRIGLRERVLIQEQTGQQRLAGLVGLVRRIAVTTFAFELAGALVLGIVIGRTRHLSLAGAAFQGLFHAVSAFCNAGFDILGDSLVSFRTNAVVILTVGFLIIAGGIGFHVLVDLYANRFKWTSLSLHSRLALKVTAALILLGTFSFLAIEGRNPGTMGQMRFGDKLLSSWFQAVTPRTAGFNSIPEDRLLPAAAFLTMVLMFIGASPGGTGGGTKTTTFAVVATMLRAAIVGQHDVTVQKRRLPPDVVTKAVAILMLSLMLVVSATLVLTLTEDAPFLDLLFEATSAFGTVGLSRGVTPHLSDAGKLVLMMTMFAGRVGPLSLAIALSRGKSNSALRYPEERVTVG